MHKDEEEKKSLQNMFGNVLSKNRKTVNQLSLAMPELDTDLQDKFKQIKLKKQRPTQERMTSVSKLSNTSSGLNRTSDNLISEFQERISHKSGQNPIGESSSVRFSKRDTGKDNHRKKFLVSVFQETIKEEKHSEPTTKLTILISGENGEKIMEFTVKQMLDEIAVEIIIQEYMLVKTAQNLIEKSTEEASSLDVVRNEVSGPIILNALKSEVRHEVKKILYAYQQKQKIQKINSMSCGYVAQNLCNSVIKEIIQIMFGNYAIHENAIVNYSEQIILQNSVSFIREIASQIISSENQETEVIILHQVGKNVSEEIIEKVAKNESFELGKETLQKEKFILEEISTSLINEMIQNILTDIVKDLIKLGDRDSQIEKELCEEIFTGVSNKRINNEIKYIYTTEFLTEDFGKSLLNLSIESICEDVNTFVISEMLTMAKLGLIFSEAIVNSAIKEQIHKIVTAMQNNQEITQLAASEISDNILISYCRNEIGSLIPGIQEELKTSDSENTTIALQTFDSMVQSQILGIGASTTGKQIMKLSLQESQKYFKICNFYFLGSKVTKEITEAFIEKNLKEKIGEIAQRIIQEKLISSEVSNTLIDEMMDISQLLSKICEDFIKAEKEEIERSESLYEDYTGTLCCSLIDHTLSTELIANSLLIEFEEYQTKSFIKKEVEEKNIIYCSGQIFDDFNKKIVSEQLQKFLEEEIIQSKIIDQLREPIEESLIAKELNLEASKIMVELEIEKSIITSLTTQTVKRILKEHILSEQSQQQIIISQYKQGKRENVYTPKSIIRGEMVKDTASIFHEIFVNKVNKNELVSLITKMYLQQIVTHQVFEEFIKYQLKEIAKDEIQQIKSNQLQETKELEEEICEKIVHKTLHQSILIIAKEEKSNWELENEEIIKSKIADEINLKIENIAIQDLTKTTIENISDSIKEVDEISQEIFAAVEEDMITDSIKAFYGIYTINSLRITIQNSIEDLTFNFLSKNKILKEVSSIIIDTTIERLINLLINEIINDLFLDEIEEEVRIKASKIFIQEIIQNCIQSESLENVVASEEMGTIENKITKNGIIGLYLEEECLSECANETFEKSLDNIIPIFTISCISGESSSKLFLEKIISQCSSKLLKHVSKKCLLDTKLTNECEQNILSSIFENDLVKHIKIIAGEEILNENIFEDLIPGALRLFCKTTIKEFFSENQEEQHIVAKKILKKSKRVSHSKNMVDQFQEIKKTYLPKFLLQKVKQIDLQGQFYKQMRESTIKSLMLKLSSDLLFEERLIINLSDEFWTSLSKNEMISCIKENYDEEFLFISTAEQISNDVISSVILISMKAEIDRIITEVKIQKALSRHYLDEILQNNCRFQIKEQYIEHHISFKYFEELFSSECFDNIINIFSGEIDTLVDLNNLGKISSKYEEIHQCIKRSKDKNSKLKEKEIIKKNLTLDLSSSIAKQLVDFSIWDILSDIWSVHQKDSFLSPVPNIVIRREHILNKGCNSAILHDLLEFISKQILMEMVMTEIERQEILNMEIDNYCQKTIVSIYSDETEQYLRKTKANNLIQEGVEIIIQNQIVNSEAKKETMNQIFWKASDNMAKAEIEVLFNTYKKYTTLNQTLSKYFVDSSIDTVCKVQIKLLIQNSQINLQQNDYVANEIEEKLCFSFIQNILKTECSEIHQEQTQMMNVGTQIANSIIKKTIEGTIFNSIVNFQLSKEIIEKIILKKVNKEIQLSIKDEFQPNLHQMILINLTPNQKNSDEQLELKKNVRIYVISNLSIQNAYENELTIFLDKQLNSIANNSLKEIQFFITSTIENEISNAIEESVITKAINTINEEIIIENEISSSITESTWTSIESELIKICIKSFYGICIINSLKLTIESSIEEQVIREIINELLDFSKNEIQIENKLSNQIKKDVENSVVSKLIFTRICQEQAFKDFSTDLIELFLKLQINEISLNELNLELCSDTIMEDLQFQILSTILMDIAKDTITEFNIANECSSSLVSTITRRSIQNELVEISLNQIILLQIFEGIIPGALSKFCKFTIKEYLSQNTEIQQNVAKKVLKTQKKQQQKNISPIQIESIRKAYLPKFLITQVKQMDLQGQIFSRIRMVACKEIIADLIQEVITQENILENISGLIFNDFSTKEIKEQIITVHSKEQMIMNEISTFIYENISSYSSKNICHQIGSGLIKELEIGNSISNLLYYEFYASNCKKEVLNFWMDEKISEELYQELLYFIEIEEVIKNIEKETEGSLNLNQLSLVRHITTEFQESRYLKIIEEKNRVKHFAFVQNLEIMGLLLKDMVDNELWDLVTDIYFVQKNSINFQEISLVKVRKQQLIRKELSFCILNDLFRNTILQSMQQERDELEYSTQISYSIMNSIFSERIINFFVNEIGKKLQRLLFDEIFEIQNTKIINELITMEESSKNELARLENNIIKTQISKIFESELMKQILSKTIFETIMKNVENKLIVSIFEYISKEIIIQNNLAENELEKECLNTAHLVILEESESLLIKQREIHEISFGCFENFIDNAILRTINNSMQLMKISNEIIHCACQNMIRKIITKSVQNEFDPETHKKFVKILGLSKTSGSAGSLMMKNKIGKIVYQSCAINQMSHSLLEDFNKNQVSFYSAKWLQEIENLIILEIVSAIELTIKENVIEIILNNIIHDIQETNKMTQHLVKKVGKNFETKVITNIAKASYGNYAINSLRNRFEISIQGMSFRFLLEKALLKQVTEGYLDFYIIDFIKSIYSEYQDKISIEETYKSIEIDVCRKVICENYKECSKIEKLEVKISKNIEENIEERLINNELFQRYMDELTENEFYHCFLLQNLNNHTNSICFLCLAFETTSKNILDDILTQSQTSILTNISHQVIDNAFIENEYINDFYSEIIQNLMNEMLIEISIQEILVFQQFGGLIPGALSKFCKYIIKEYFSTNPEEQKNIAKKILKKHKRQQAHSVIIQKTSESNVIRSYLPKIILHQVNQINLQKEIYSQIRQATLQSLISELASIQITEENILSFLAQKIFDTFSEVQVNSSIVQLHSKELAMLDQCSSIIFENKAEAFISMTCKEIGKDLFKEFNIISELADSQLNEYSYKISESIISNEWCDARISTQILFESLNCYQLEIILDCVSQEINNFMDINKIETMDQIISQNAEMMTRRTNNENVILGNNLKDLFSVKIAAEMIKDLIDFQVFDLASDTLKIFSQNDSSLQVSSIKISPEKILNKKISFSLLDQVLEIINLQLSISEGKIGVDISNILTICIDNCTRLNIYEIMANEVINVLMREINQAQINESIEILNKQKTLQTISMEKFCKEYFSVAIENLMKCEINQLFYLFKENTEITQLVSEINRLRNEETICRQLIEELGENLIKNQIIFNQAELACNEDLCEFVITNEISQSAVLLQNYQKEIKEISLQSFNQLMKNATLKIVLDSEFLYQTNEREIEAGLKKIICQIIYKVIKSEYNPSLHPEFIQTIYSANFQSIEYSDLKLNLSKNIINENAIFTYLDSFLIQTNRKITNNFIQDFIQNQIRKHIQNSIIDCYENTVIQDFIGDIFHRAQITNKTTHEISNNIYSDLETTAISNIAKVSYGNYAINSLKDLQTLFLNVRFSFLAKSKLLKQISEKISEGVIIEFSKKYYDKNLNNKLVILVASNLEESLLKTMLTKSSEECKEKEFDLTNISDLIFTDLEHKFLQNYIIECYLTEKALLELTFSFIEIFMVDFSVKLGNNYIFLVDLSQWVEEQITFQIGSAIIKETFEDYENELFLQNECSNIISSDLIENSLENNIFELGKEEIILEHILEDLIPGALTKFCKFAIKEYFANNQEEQGQVVKKVLKKNKKQLQKQKQSTSVQFSQNIKHLYLPKFLVHQVKELDLQNHVLMIIRIPVLEKLTAQISANIIQEQKILSELSKAFEESIIQNQVHHFAKKLLFHERSMFQSISNIMYENYSEKEILNLILNSYFDEQFFWEFWNSLTNMENSPLISLTKETITSCISDSLIIDLNDINFESIIKNELRILCKTCLSEMMILSTTTLNIWDNLIQFFTNKVCIDFLQFWKQIEVDSEVTLKKIEENCIAPEIYLLGSVLAVGENQIEMSLNSFISSLSKKLLQQAIHEEQAVNSTLDALAHKILSSYLSECLDVDILGNIFYSKLETALQNNLFFEIILQTEVEDALCLEIEECCATLLIHDLSDLAIENEKSSKEIEDSILEKNSYNEITNIGSQCLSACLIRNSEPFVFSFLKTTKNIIISEYLTHKIYSQLQSSAISFLTKQIAKITIEKKILRLISEDSLSVIINILPKWISQEANILTTNYELSEISLKESYNSLSFRISNNLSFGIISSQLISKDIYFEIIQSLLRQILLETIIECLIQDDMQNRTNANVIKQIGKGMYEAEKLERIISENLSTAILNSFLSLECFEVSCLNCIGFQFFDEMIVCLVKNLAKKTITKSICHSISKNDKQIALLKDALYIPKKIRIILINHQIYSDESEQIQNTSILDLLHNLSKITYNFESKSIQDSIYCGEKILDLQISEIILDSFKQQLIDQYFEELCNSFLSKESNEIGQNIMKSLEINEICFKKLVDKSVLQYSTQIIQNLRIQAKIEVEISVNIIHQYILECIHETFLNEIFERMKKEFLDGGLQEVINDTEISLTMRKNHTFFMKYMNTVLNFVSELYLHEDILNSLMKNDLSFLLVECIDDENNEQINAISKDILQEKIHNHVEITALNEFAIQFMSSQIVTTLETEIFLKTVHKIEKNIRDKLFQETLNCVADELVSNIISNEFTSLVINTNAEENQERICELSIIIQDDFIRKIMSQIFFNEVLIEDITTKAFSKMSENCIFNAIEHEIVCLPEFPQKIFLNEEEIEQSFPAYFSKKIMETKVKLVVLENLIDNCCFDYLRTIYTAILEEKVQEASFDEIKMVSLDQSIEEIAIHDTLLRNFQGYCSSIQDEVIFSEISQIYSKQILAHSKKETTNFMNKIIVYFKNDFAANIAKNNIINEGIKPRIKEVANFCQKIIQGSSSSLSNGWLNSMIKAEIFEVCESTLMDQKDKEKTEKIKQQFNNHQKGKINLGLAQHSKNKIEDFIIEDLIIQTFEELKQPTQSDKFSNEIYESMEYSICKQIMIEAAKFYKGWKDEVTRVAQKVTLNMFVRVMNEEITDLVFKNQSFVKDASLLSEYFADGYMNKIISSTLRDCISQINLIPETGNPQSQNEMISSYDYHQATESIVHMSNQNSSPSIGAEAARCQRRKSQGPEECYSEMGEESKRSDEEEDDDNHDLELSYMEDEDMDEIPDNEMSPSKNSCRMFEINTKDAKMSNRKKGEGYELITLKAIPEANINDVDILCINCHEWIAYSEIPLHSQYCVKQIKINAPEEEREDLDPTINEKIFKIIKALHIKIDKIKIGKSKDDALISQFQQLYDIGNSALMNNSSLIDLEICGANTTRIITELNLVLQNPKKKSNDDLILAILIWAKRLSQLIFIKITNLERIGIMPHPLIEDEYENDEFVEKLILANDIEKLKLETQDESAYLSKWKKYYSTYNDKLTNANPSNLEVLSEIDSEIASVGSRESMLSLSSIGSSVSPFSVRSTTESFEEKKDTLRNRTTTGQELQADETRKRFYQMAIVIKNQKPEKEYYMTYSQMYQRVQQLNIVQEEWHDFLLNLLRVNK